MLGQMTVSMLEGDRGVLRKEFEKLLDWTRDEPVPDVINLPNSLLIGLARPLRRAFGRPICCTLQGEDLFLDGLVEPYRQRAIDLIRAQVADVDSFHAVSQFYAPMMAGLLQIPAAQMDVVPLGITMLLVTGLVIGTVCALVAIAPAATERGAHLGLTGQSWLLLLAVLAAGLVSSLIATRAALSVNVVGTLRSE